jgi:hypothetical protein
VQLLKIGDLSLEQAGLTLSGDAPGEEAMEVDEDIRLPDGSEGALGEALSAADEALLVRESTAGFGDWAPALLRRVLALFENLPEEGGRRQTTGGKAEETVLRAVKSMLDVVCLHLSAPLFKRVLDLVADYAALNARANAVRAFGQLVACLARVQPRMVLERFLGPCVERIEDELRHGASGVRTTSSHAAAPSDTTLHWSGSLSRIGRRPQMLTIRRYLHPPRLPRIRWAGGKRRVSAGRWHRLTCCAAARPPGRDPASRAAARRQDAQRARVQHHRPTTYAPPPHALGHVPAPRALRERRRVGLAR